MNELIIDAENDQNNKRKELLQHQQLLQSLINMNSKNSTKLNQQNQQEQKEEQNDQPNGQQQQQQTEQQQQQLSDDNLWDQLNQNDNQQQPQKQQQSKEKFKNQDNQKTQDLQQIYICSTEQNSPINRQKGTGNSQKLRMSLLKSFQQNVINNKNNLQDSEIEVNEAVNDIKKILKKIKSYKEYSQKSSNHNSNVNAELADQNQVFQQFQQTITLSTQEDQNGSNSYKQMSIISNLYTENEENKDNDLYPQYTQEDETQEQEMNNIKINEFLSSPNDSNNNKNNQELYENPFTYRIEKAENGINIAMQNNASKQEEQIIFERFIPIYTSKQKLHQFIEIVSLSKKYDPSDQNPIFFVYDNMSANYYEMKIIKFEDEDDEDFSHNFHLSFTQTFNVDENEKEIIIECFINKHELSNNNYLILMKQFMQINELEQEDNEYQKIKDYIKIAEAYQKLFNPSVSVQFYHRVIDYYRRNSICNDIQIQALINIINLYYEQNDYQSALKAGNCAILFAQTLKENILIQMKAFLAVGDVYLKQQNYSEAIKLFEKIIDLSNDFFEKFNIKSINIQINVNELIIQGGETNEQLGQKQVLVSQLRKRCEQIEQEEIVALIHQKLAQIYEETNMFQQSTDMMLESIQAIKSIISTLELYKLYQQYKQKSPISPIIQKQGYSVLRNSTFKFIYQKKDQIDKGIRKNKLDLANIYQQLAARYLQSQEEFESALDYYTRAKKIYEEMYHPLHWIVAEQLNNIALVYLHMLEFEKAVQNFKKALQIKKQVYNPDHYSIALSCTHLGCAFAKFAHFEEALQYYKKALIIFQQKSQDRHVDLGETYNNIANVYSSIGDFNNALQYYEKAERIFCKIMNADDITFGQLFENIGIALFSMQQFYKGYTYFKKSESIYLTLFDQEHPLCTRIRIWSQKALNNMNEYELQKVKQNNSIVI